jgi:hypothetical protein
VITTPDRLLELYTVQAETTAARLRSHDRFCEVCSALEDPAKGPCARRRQLDRQLQARRALVNSRRKALGRR